MEVVRPGNAKGLRRPIYAITIKILLLEFHLMYHYNLVRLGIISCLLICNFIAILLQAASPLQQLEMITDLLGTPTVEDMKNACAAAIRHVLSKGPKVGQLHRLFNLGESASRDAVHLLCQLLTLSPDRRISVQDALAHPYLDEGRMRYHSCMCRCCPIDSRTGGKSYASNFEPPANTVFEDAWEREMDSVAKVRRRLHRFVPFRTFL